IAYECERIVLDLNAVQKGLQQYEWTIISNGITVFSTASVTDRFEYEITRSTSVDQNIEVKLITTNLTNCKSEMVSKTLVVKKTDVISASFTASPLIQQFPDATVTISNTTNTGPWHYL